MVRATGSKNYRDIGGYTITELLITTLLIGIVIAVIGELVVVNTFAIWKTTNKSDAVNSTRWAIERISADVRKARCVGDHYALLIGDLNQFPADVGNPLYFATPPLGGWPWSGAPYVLSPQCLILQLPVLFEDTTPGTGSTNPRNGFPSMIPAGALGSRLPVTNVENLETVIYQLVPDPLIPGEYMLQVVRLPGAPIYNYTTAALPPYSVEQLNCSPQVASSLVNPPQTLVRGIIGPLVNGGPTPSIFSYYYVTPGSLPTLLPQTASVPAPLVPSVSGVALDLEVKKPIDDQNSSTLPYQETIASHAEAALRYNKNVTLTNFAH
jgi:type II secretory pathway pseudopilin PulG